MAIQFNPTDFELYNVTAPSFSNGINAGYWTLPNMGPSGIPTGNSYPYSFTFNTLSEPLASISMPTPDSSFITLGSIPDSLCTRKVQGTEQFYGIQFDYPRSIKITTNADITILISFADINNNKRAFYRTVDSGTQLLWTGVNILNSIQVTSTVDNTTVSISLEPIYEMPYVDYFAPTATDILPSYNIEMISFDPITSTPEPNDFLSSGLFIKTYGDNASYPLVIAPTTYLNNELTYERPLVDLTELDQTIKEGSNFLIWQTIFPTYSKAAQDSSKGGLSSGNTLLELEGAYETGEAIYGSVPDATDWTGWNS